MTQVAVVTVARSDFSILRPVMAKIADDPDLDLRVIAAGMHLAPQYGMTVDAVEAAGFAVSDRVEMLLASDTPEGTAKSTGLGLIGYGQAFARSRPDILVVMGDRFEMFAAAAAALPFGITVAHIHGGELSEGAIDDAMRHCISKLAHIHFTSTETYRQRVIQLGESPDRVIASGAPALDNLGEIALLSRAELETRFGLDLSVPPILVTFHPTTLELDGTGRDAQALLNALDTAARPVVFTAPNADAGGALIRAMIDQAVASRPHWRFVTNLGLEGYYGLLGEAAAMVGNSSSGIIEAASFKLPVVNIGNRQKGRLTAQNVLHVAAEQDAITTAIATACSDAFRQSLSDLVNPYGTGRAGEIILRGLKAAALWPQPVLKTFHDLESTP